MDVGLPRGMGVEVGDHEDVSVPARDLAALGERHDVLVVHVVQAYVAQPVAEGCARRNLVDALRYGARD
jgi:hypothetical protein